MDIVNSIYDSNDYGKIHECLNYWKNDKDLKVNDAVTKMMEVYPKNVLKDYIISSLNTAENFVFYRNSLAASTAYNSFKQYIFKYGKINRNHIHPRTA